MPSSGNLLIFFIFGSSFARTLNSHLYLDSPNIIQPMNQQYTEANINCLQYYAAKYHDYIVQSSFNYGWREHFCTTELRYDTECATGLPNCKCNVDKYSMNCENLNLTLWPTNIHQNTRLCLFKGNRLNESWTTNTFANYEHVEYINLENNHITYLEPFMFDRLVRLKVLELGYNEIHELVPDVFSGLHLLTDVIIVHNKLTRLRNDTFRGLQSLSNLQLSDNQIVHIEDSSFRSLNELKILSLRNNKLTKFDWNVLRYTLLLTAIDLSGNNIRTIETDALDLLKHLILIDLSHNQIAVLKSFTFRNIPLTALNMEYNEIRRVEDNAFFELSGLKKVNLMHNKLRTLCWSAFHVFSILQLTLAYNHIESIECDRIATNMNLEELDLSNNRLTNLQFLSALTYQPELIELNASCNRIDELEIETFDKFPRLQFIDLSYNNLKNFRWPVFRNLTRLSNLRVHHNQIANIESDGYTKIPDRELDFSYNDLATITRFSFFLLEARYNINLSHNKIDCIEDGAFRGSIENSIMYLHTDLDYNRLKILKSNTFHIFGGQNEIRLNHNRIESMENQTFVFHDNTILRLYLSYNQLTTFELNHISTVNRATVLFYVLNVDHNPIKSIAPNTFFEKKFHHLYLNDMNLRTLTSDTFRGMKNVHELHLQNNQISIMDSLVFNHTGFEKTEILKLQSNNITHLSPYMFQTMQQLEDLNLAHNAIAKIEPFTFQGIINLRRLFLNYNNLTKLTVNTFDGLTLLDQLYLQHNRIQFIENFCLSDLRQLQFLNLSYNELHQVTDKTFSGLKMLRSLYMQNNKINAIEKYVFRDTDRLSELRTDEFRFCCLAKQANCTPLPDTFSSCEDLLNSAVLVIGIWTIGLAAIFANTYVILFRSRTSTNRITKGHSFLIRNLAISDLFMGIYLMIVASADLYTRGEYFLYAYQWRTSYACDFAGFLSTFSSELTVFTLCVITIDRLLGVMFPFKTQQRTMSTNRLLLGAGWIVAALIALIPLQIFNIDYFKSPSSLYGFYGRSGVCLPLHLTADTPDGWEYSVFIFIFLNAVAFAIIAIGYSFIFIIANRRKPLTSTANRTQPRTMAFRMTLLVLADAACWLPIISLGIRSMMGHSTPPSTYAWIAVLVLPLNAALNPILYTISSLINIKFRSPFYTA